eukprot:Gregarina_sp_Poly_1__5493@NODE_28_length_19636_cov_263_287087_g25_i0_p8_GENE_NODE_28_length_19636_cov_263_287087_g25_i0NODE_28_length_19636_cov_263_287087_g25_i0_p8_ORF_typecomplete_len385_score80_32_NODE_28_length_19636_cov_263_287087_g25_i01438615540
MRSESDIDGSGDTPVKKPKEEEIRPSPNEMPAVPIRLENVSLEAEDNTMGDVTDDAGDNVPMSLEADKSESVQLGSSYSESESGSSSSSEEEELDENAAQHTEESENEMISAKEAPEPAPVKRARKAPAPKSTEMAHRATRAGGTKVGSRNRGVSAAAAPEGPVKKKRSVRGNVKSSVEAPPASQEEPAKRLTRTRKAAETTKEGVVEKPLRGRRGSRSKMEEPVTKEKSRETAAADDEKKLRSEKKVAPKKASKKQTTATTTTKAKAKPGPRRKGSTEITVSQTAEAEASDTGNAEKEHQQTKGRGSRTAPLRSAAEPPARVTRRAAQGTGEASKDSKEYKKRAPSKPVAESRRRAGSVDGVKGKPEPAEERSKRQTRSRAAK